MLMNMIYTLDVSRIYPVLDWRSTIGILIPILMMLFTIVVQHLMVTCHKKKLRMHEKDSIINQIDKINECQKI